MAKLTVRDVDVAGRKVLVRVDFNVPLDAGGQITDDTRIVASLPTIQYLLENGAAVILMSPLGRPKDGHDPKLSLAPTAARLQELLGSSTTVRFAGDCPGAAGKQAARELPQRRRSSAAVRCAGDCGGDEVKQAARHLQPGEVLLLENVRFHKEEEANDSDFAGQLASLADLYVNDAFG